MEGTEGNPPYVEGRRHKSLGGAAPSAVPIGFIVDIGGLTRVRGSMTLPLFWRPRQLVVGLSGWRFGAIKALPGTPPTRVSSLSLTPYPRNALSNPDHAPPCRAREILRDFEAFYYQDRGERAPTSFEK